MLMQSSPLICQVRVEVLLRNLNQSNVLPGEVENSKIWCVICHFNLFLLIPVYTFMFMYFFIIILMSIFVYLSAFAGQLSWK